MYIVRRYVFFAVVQKTICLIATLRWQQDKEGDGMVPWWLNCGCRWPLELPQETDTGAEDCSFF
jgi:hypothetical protein